jgi:hypothetical protein
MATRVWLSRAEMGRWPARRARWQRAAGSSECIGYGNGRTGTWVTRGGARSEVVEGFVDPEAFPAGVAQVALSGQGAVLDVTDQLGLDVAGVAGVLPR